jgi:CRISPR-associated protein Cas6
MEVTIVQPKDENQVGREPMPYVDLAFRMTGATIPVDHGYSLYSAVNHLIDIHDANGIGLHPIRGVYSGDGNLRLTTWSRLIFRVPDDQIRVYLKLAGKKLDVNGCALRIGIPEVRLLRSAPTLRARIVTIKGFQEEEPFLEAAKRQLHSLGISSSHAMAGERRTFRVKDKQVVGFEFIVSGLTADESLSLQVSGIGGRRRMGCGIFITSKVVSTNELVQKAVGKKQ